MDTIAFSIEKECQCMYCHANINIYNEIYSGGKGRWLTISPPYDSLDAGSSVNKWFNLIKTFKKFTKHLLGVVEFANDRTHFHICYKLNNACAKRIILNAIRIGSTGTNNKYPPCMVRDYAGKPAKGLHYLFKDIDNTKELIDRPVLNSDEDGDIILMAI